MGSGSSSEVSGKCIKKPKKNPKLQIDPESPIGLMIKAWNKEPYKRMVENLKLSKEEYPNVESR